MNIGAIKDDVPEGLGDLIIEQRGDAPLKGCFRDKELVIKNTLAIEPKLIIGISGAPDPDHADRNLHNAGTTIQLNAAKGGKLLTDLDAELLPHRFVDSNFDGVFWVGGGRYGIGPFDQRRILFKATNKGIVDPGQWIAHIRIGRLLRRKKAKIVGFGITDRHAVRQDQCFGSLVGQIGIDRHNIVPLFHAIE